MHCQSEEVFLKKIYSDDETVSVFPVDSLYLQYILLLYSMNSLFYNWNVRMHYLLLFNCIFNCYSVLFLFFQETYFPEAFPYVRQIEMHRL